MKTVELTGKRVTVDELLELAATDSIRKKAILSFISNSFMRWR